MRALRGVLALWVMAGAACGPTVEQGPDVLAMAQTTFTWRVVGRALNPGIVLVVDRSASMALANDPTNPACPPGCGTFTACPAECPTRLDEARRIADSFLDDWTDHARLGLVTFPADEQCTGPTVPQVMPVSAEREGDWHALGRSAEQIRWRLQAATPMGGAPLAAALQAAGRPDSMHDLNTDHFVVLLTAGGPPCNGRPCSTGCVDVDATVAAVRALSLQSIEVIVVAVGPEVTSGETAETLETIARAGSTFFSSCGPSVPCANGSECTSGQCARSFVLPSEVPTLLTPTPPGDAWFCDFALRTVPERPEYLSVLLNGDKAGPGPDSWSLAPERGTMRLEGAACRAARNSTVYAPYEIVVRILEVY